MLKTETEVTIYYFAVRDECGAQGPRGLMDRTATEKARKKGWLLLGADYHFCPEHKETPRAIRIKAELEHQERSEGLRGLVEDLRKFNAEKDKKNTPPKTEE